MSNGKFGPILRAIVLLGLGSFAGKTLVGVLADEAARQPGQHMVNGVIEIIPLVPRPTSFHLAVWGSALAVVLLCGLVAWRMVAETRVPAGTRVFPRLALTPVAEAVMSIAGGFLLIGIAMLPRIFADGFDGGIRGGDVVSLLVLAIFGALLLLWRPVFLLRRGAPVVRCPVGFWFPWRQVLRADVRLEWESFFAGNSPRVQVGWMLRAKIGKQQFDVEYADRDLPAPDRESLREQWQGALLSRSGGPAGPA